MSVIHDGFEYTFYIGANGKWTIHVYDLSRPADEGQWIVSYYDASEHRPRFTTVPSRSTVTYNAWA